jgi:hypothetical protein
MIVRIIVMQILAALLVVILPDLHGPGAMNAGEVTTNAPKQNGITSLRAFLYYQEKGEFNREDILSGRVSLRNVVGGISGAEGPSGAILVLVGVRHTAFGQKTPVSTFVKLTAKAGKKNISTQEVNLRSFWSEQETIEVPFMVHRTGCEPLEITASFVEQNKTVSSLSRTANFHCGE